MKSGNRTSGRQVGDVATNNEINIRTRHINAVSATDRPKEAVPQKSKYVRAG